LVSPAGRFFESEDRLKRGPKHDPKTGLRTTIEWPTIMLAVAVYAGWMAVTWYHAMFPLWALMLLGGWCVAWQSSLQHETIHGHPSPSRAFNTLIGAVPLSLWLPYGCYRRDHLAHHAAETVTDPRIDPESRYLLPAAGSRGTIARTLAALQAPLAGRLILGPPIGIASFLVDEVRRARKSPIASLRNWGPHIFGVALVVLWLSTCQLGLGRYLLAFVYPGSALTLLRSFAEHRAAQLPDHRVAIVERAGPFALLFLHNNLHAVHHDAPGMAWYRIPAHYRAHRDQILRANGGLLYRGYGEIARRYGLRAHDALIHPDLPALEGTR
jgi:fatty acid desaturase